MSQIKSHKLYYIFLVTMLLLCLFLILFSAPNKTLQGSFLVLSGLIYFFFGTFHHIQNHDFHPKIMIEYALIASLGIVSGLFFLKVGLGL